MPRFFFQAEDGIRDADVTGVQTCALPISLSFVGLIAPHLARVLGQQTVGRQMLVAALAGGLLLSLADYLARVLVYPNQLPAGLLAALVGGLYFLWGLSRHGRA